MPRTPRASRAYALENAAFLRALRRTGNEHEAARAVDASRSRFTRRRAKDPAFAARWDAALVIAQAALQNPPAASARVRTDSAPVLVLRRDGTVQLRRLLATAISPAAEQRFLLALASCANVRLAARAAGFSHASFYARKRRNPGFAKAWQAALAHGYERLQLALIESWGEHAHEHDAWAHNVPPPMPPMSPNQALQLMYLHQKEARSFQEPQVLRRRRGESHEARVVRQALIYEAWQDRDRAAFRDAELVRKARGEGPYWGDDLPDPHEPPAPVLPDLVQLTQMSRARPPGPPRRRANAAPTRRPPRPVRRLAHRRLAPRNGGGGGRNRLDPPGKGQGEPGAAEEERGEGRKQE